MNAVAAMPMPLAQKRAGLVTVRTLLSNVVDQPGDEIYIRVKKSNPKVQKLFPQCHELLRLAGFSDDGDAFVYNVGKTPGPQLHEALVYVEAILASLPHAGDGPDGAAEQHGRVASGPCLPRPRDVTEVAGDVLVTALPTEKVREGLRTVCLLLSRVKTQPEAQGRVQVPSSLMALADFPLSIDLLRCAGFEDWEGSLVYRGMPRGDEVEVVQDVALALLSSSVDECAIETVSQGSSSESAAADVVSRVSPSEQRGPGRRQGRVDRFAGRRAELQRVRAEQRAAAADARQAPFAPQPRGTASATAQQVPLHSIRFSQSSIASTFQNGRSVEETVQQLRSGTLHVEALPTIRVVEHMNLLWSLDNRRLHCMKKAFPERSHPDKLVTVQLEALSSRRVRDEFLRKFTTGTTIEQRGG